MLVPHEPEKDPRVRWVTQLCEHIGWTEIVGAICLPWNVTVYHRPRREYTGRVWVDRITILDYASPWWQWAARVMAWLLRPGLVEPFLAWRRLQYEIASQPRSNGIETERSGATLRKRLARRLGGVAYGLNALISCFVLASALYRRGRATSVPPRVVIGHDVFGLLAAVALKRQTGCQVVYDAHEFWPEADVVAPRWQQRLMAQIERRAIRQADVVVTVNPLLAGHLETVYGLQGVISAPNAAPFGESDPPAERASMHPLRFLFQGGAAPGRGIEDLLETWREIPIGAAVLYVRCPVNEYLSAVLERYRSLIEEQRVVVLKPVSESDLIQAARFADVGLIPYRGPSLNHLYCCPNKLSQYMQAGLAVVANDLPFVAEVLRRYDCGVVYDAEDLGSLRRTVETLVAEPERLAQMRRNGYWASRREFNWEVQSRAYRAALERCIALPGRCDVGGEERAITKLSPAETVQP